MRAFEVLGSEPVLEGRAFRIRRDHLRTPDGRETKFEIVEHGGSVVLVPIDDRGELVQSVLDREPAGLRDLPLLLLAIAHRDEDAHRLPPHPGHII